MVTSSESGQADGPSVGATEPLTAASFGPRAWWIYLQLSTPRSVFDMAESGGVSLGSIRTPLAQLRIAGLATKVDGPRGDHQVWARSKELHPELLLSVEMKVARANLAKPRHSLAVLVPVKVGGEWRAPASCRCGQWTVDLSAPTESVLRARAEHRWRKHAAERSRGSAAVPAVEVEGSRQLEEFVPSPSQEAPQRRALAVVAAVVLGVIAIVVALNVGGSADDTVAGQPPDTVAASASEPPPPQEKVTADIAEGPGEVDAPVTSEPTPEEVADSPASYADDEAGDMALVTYVEMGDYPYFSTVSAANLTSLGQALCQDLDAGYTPYELSFQIMGSFDGLDETEAAAFVGAAIGSYCYQHKDKW